MWSGSALVDREDAAWSTGRCTTRSAPAGPDAQLGVVAGPQGETSRCRLRYGPAVAAKYFTIGSVATIVHHRGPTTLPGHPPAATSGVTVLCLHDLAGNGRTFDGVLDALADAHRPVAFDLPAHGRSGGLDSLDGIGAMAAHAKAVADALGLDRPVLLGDGMGAAIAIEAAATWPEWPAAVVVCGGASASPAPDPATIEQVRAVTAGRARRQFDTTGYAPDTPRAVYERAFGEWMKTDPRATVGDLVALASWDGAARLGAVTAPVVVVVGEHEEPTTRDPAEALAAGVADGRVAELGGAGRRGVVEQPEALADLVADVAAAGVAA
jgi:3-oxoadipate enol-lactonase